ncbi:flagellar export protein FliJ [Paenibacillus sp.]|uniref:flagellar export protein FliJ n=1 Tax=Paenibacillus sp. TaxID=58172 RepID=UPI002D45C7FA|nr:flagellar export protein FliJ [Paenibacillus sp.]HZG84399.1 flagellar export protein FliJ [Paenibacillus sp.]
MKFVYPFQKVLDVKTNEKKEAESRLAEAFGALREAESELREAAGEKERAQTRLAEEALGALAMAEVIASQRYIDYLDERIKAAERKMREAERRVAELRERLTDKSMDEKIWLNAKDKALAEHRKEAERRLQHELDEMATARSRYAY